MRESILQELLMDILWAQLSPNHDICKKTLEVAMDIITSRNVKDVVRTSKREVQKTTSETDTSVDAKGAELRYVMF